MNILDMDKARYLSGKVPQFQKYFRLAESAKFKPLKKLFYYIALVEMKKRCIEIPRGVQIGGYILGMPTVLLSIQKW